MTVLSTSSTVTPFFLVDAFTAAAFAGNPAGVCLLATAKDAAWMQQVARELNLNATAFVARRGDGYHLRWFTTSVELDLCGHGTLASAHVLWETGQLAPDAPARFETRSGPLTATRRGDYIELDFPATPAAPVAAPAGLAEALGATPVYVGRSRFDYLVELEDEAAVRALQPDLAKLSAIETRGVIVTSRADAGSAHDFVSRFFAPRVGIAEDPATGSAHCCLAAYWQARLGKDRFLAHQISSRGGVLQLTIEGDRVRLAGQAVTVVRGELLA
jgi:PhzF family phenazine biosynthesis protein